MKISTLKENLYSEDKMMCAVTCETSYGMVNDVLYGRRNKETELGKAIMSKLEKLARINMAAKKKKTELIAA